MAKANVIQRVNQGISRVFSLAAGTAAMLTGDNAVHVAQCTEILYAQTQSKFARTFVPAVAIY